MPPDFEEIHMNINAPPKLANQMPHSGVLRDMEPYSSKAISLRARNDPAIVDLSFGEPAFGPPEHLLAGIASEDLIFESFSDGLKHYEEPRGHPGLRCAIADWYQRRYGLVVCPDTEILVTNGAVEAITLAVLATTDAGDSVSVTNPSYMLYARTIKTLGREVSTLIRPPAHEEYLEPLNNEHSLATAKLVIVNSPENPTGYVLSDSEWDRLGVVASQTRTWVLHDESYDVMTCHRPHRPARSIVAIRDQSILVNSLSKKFGVPGLRIGWLVAPAPLIELAAKVHDYLYLSVNISNEKIARRLLVDPLQATWFDRISNQLHLRRHAALAVLGDTAGYSWPRRPMGGMFLFPDVSRIYEWIPSKYRRVGLAIGNAVADYLLEERRVASVPGSVYGSQGDCHIRFVLCTSTEAFEIAMDRLRLQ